MGIKKEKTFSNSSSGSQFIKCACGYKILILPDSAAMNQAIESHVLENHLLEHSNKNKDVAAAEAEAERIRDDLISQLFKKIGKSKS